MEVVSNIHHNTTSVKLAVERSNGIEYSTNLNIIYFIAWVTAI